MHTHHEQSAGAAIGGVCGFLKSITMVNMINMQTVFETMLLSAVGAVVGFLVTSLLKYLKSKIFK